MVIESELDQAGHKPSKEERKVMSARDTVIKKYLGDTEGPAKQKKFADPVNMF